MNDKTAILVAAVASLSACDPLVLDLGSDRHATGVELPGAGGHGGGGACTPGATASCYDGPPGTEGVGLCKAGTKVCNADGMSYGACTGEVTPKPEDCATPFDEDCDGAAPACKGKLLWAKSFGDASDQVGFGVAVDEAGNAAVVGSFRGSIDFGGESLNAGVGAGAFVSKLDPMGSPTSATGFYSSGYLLAEGVTFTAAGEAATTGYFSDTATFGGPPTACSGQIDGFLVELDAGMSPVWARSLGGPGSGLQGVATAADASGSVFVIGAFNGTVDVGGGTPLDSMGAEVTFLLKLDAEGNLLWSRTFATDHAEGLGIAVDPGGAVAITGDFRGAADFGGGILHSAGGRDVFLAKLDAAGNHLWSKRFGDAADQGGTGVAVDPVGNMVVTGAFAGVLDLGGGELASAGGTDVFVAKLDAGGNHLWSKRFGDPGDQNSVGVAVDAGGSILFTGGCAGTVDFGGGPLLGTTKTDIFLAKLDASGEHVWSKRIGGGGTHFSKALAVDSIGNVVITGGFAGTIDFGGGPLTSAGAIDVFVARFAP